MLRFYAALECDDRKTVVQLPLSTFGEVHAQVKRPP